MGYHRRRGITASPAAGDPGKDLFAYLFLLVMVFTFMLLMSFDQGGSGQNAPESSKTGSTLTAAVSAEQLGVLEKKGTRIVMRFGSAVYDPGTDMEKIEQDGRVVTMLKDGREQKVLYVKKVNESQISLYDYLETFQKLSEMHITIIFAEEVS